MRTTKTAEGTAMQSILSHPGHSFFPYWSTYYRSFILEWLDRQRQRIYLAELDQRLLDDIGVSRMAAEEEARKWT